MNTAAAARAPRRGGVPWVSGLPGGAHPANMLIPQAYEIAWTDLAQVFNETLSPGEIVTLTGVATTATASSNSSSSSATAEAPTPVTNFPTGPNTAGDRPYSNPTTATQLPLSSGSSGAILATNPNRTLLIVQNTSGSTGATFWVAFGEPATPGRCIGLAPGQSMTLDVICPRDSVNISVSGSTGSDTGVIVEGSFEIQPPPAANENVGAAAWGYGIDI